MPLGRDRFLAGGAQFATIKLFNMRTAVDKLCHHGGPRVSSPTTLIAQTRSSSELHINSDQAHLQQSSEPKPTTRDWTVFLADRDGGKELRRSRNSRECSSPIYSLSSPSLCSPNFFAGIEGHVIQVDVSSAYDRFPDPIYKHGFESTGDMYKDSERKWDPFHDVMCVDLYEHVHTNFSLMHQTRIGERKPGDMVHGWDERWYSPGGRSTSR